VKRPPFVILVQGEQGWQEEGSAKKALEALVLRDPSGPIVSIVTATSTFHVHLERVPDLGRLDIVTCLQHGLRNGDLPKADAETAPATP